ncbi:MAG: hypothetical protein ABH842_01935 [Candidatus Micrarchaeota archaeon]
MILMGGIKHDLIVGRPINISPTDRIERPAMIDRLRGTKTRLIEGIDFRVVRLDASNVASNKKKVKEQGKVEGEKLFQGMLKLLQDNFPASEIENEAQYRRYFYDRYSANWFVDVAVGNDGKVIGASLYSYCQDVNLVMHNIVVVDKDHRLGRVADSLMSRAVLNSNIRARETVGQDAEYVMGEIERIDPSIDGEEGRMRNVIRPTFHDNISRIRAIQTTDGEPLEYLLPIMATDQERQEAAAQGEPFEPESLMFCLRPLIRDEKAGIGSKETAKLLIWFYRDYLEAECSDIKPQKSRYLLAVTLAKLAPKANVERLEELLQSKRNDAKVIELIPDVQLSFMKVSETTPNQ